MLMLDTNICIYIINNRPAHVMKRFRKYEVGEIGISSITAAELAFGVEKTRSQRNKEALMMFLSPLKVLPFGEEAVWHYATLRNELQTTGQVIGALDMLIAAHALSEKATLITNNLKEFERVPNLMLDNWI